MICGHYDCGRTPLTSTCNILQNLNNDFTKPVIKLESHLRPQVNTSPFTVSRPAEVGLVFRVLVLTFSL